MSIKRFSSASLATSIAFYAIYKKCKPAIYVAACLVVISITSCYQHFYRTNTKPSTDADILQRLQSSNKYFIIHFPDRNAGLQNVTINQNNIEGDEVVLPAWHTGQLKPKTNRANMVPKAERDSVLMQVHLYTANTNISKGRVSIPVSDINRIDVYEFDQKATGLNHTLSSVGLVFTSLAVASAVILAIACNCPQVYLEDNGTTKFNGGLYSGAIYSTLERTDYMPLPAINADNTKLKIAVKNAPEEEQFINSIQLLKVNHGSDEKVLADRQGKLYSYKEPMAPFAMPGTDFEVLNKKDGKFYSFNTNDTEHRSELILKFKSDQKEGRAKLIIHAKNSAWSGFLFKEFSSLFGEDADAWRMKQEKTDPAVLTKWQRDQSLPLLVSVKNGDSWRFIDYFPLIGNTASRDMILAFDFVKSNSDFIEIKLETVYRFWDLDFAGLDLTQSSSLSSEIISAETASNKDGIDQRSAIALNDKTYSHLTANDGIDLQFALTPLATNVPASYFLVSKGYYHNLAKFSGKAKTLELLRFKDPGGFNNFSRKKYHDINRELARYEVKQKLNR